MRATTPLLIAIVLGGTVFFMLRNPALGGAETSPETASGIEPEMPRERRSTRVPAGVSPDAEAVLVGSAGSGSERASEWTVLNNRAAKLLMDGHLAESIEAFERCVEAEPDNAIFRGNLGEALVRFAREQYAARDTTPAIAMLERAMPYLVQRKDVDGLRSLLARWRNENEVESDHWSESSELFELSYDTRRTDILHHSQDVLDHLEREYDALREWFRADPVRDAMGGGNAATDPRIRVVLYTRSEFSRMTGLGDWAAGAFDGVVRVAVEDLVEERSRWQPVLSHELVHAFVLAIGGHDVPGWLNEGLAQFLERRSPRLRAAALARARARLGTTRFPLERMAGTLATWDNAEEIRRAYAQSLLFVERIATDYGEEALQRMVKGCAQDVDPAVTFEAWASVPLAFVNERL